MVSVLQQSMAVVRSSHYSVLNITGSGKSYTMMGTPSQTGIIPRLCNELFDRIAGVSYSMNFSCVFFTISLSFFDAAVISVIKLA